MHRADFHLIANVPYRKAGATGLLQMAKISGEHRNALREQEFIKRYPGLYPRVLPPKNDA
jgi:hypothetical protein